MGVIVLEIINVKRNRSLKPTRVIVSSSKRNSKKRLLF